MARDDSLAVRWLRLVLPPLYLSLMLGGCGANPMRLSGIWADPPAQQAAPGAPLYCYRNLARVDCYTGPDPQRAH